MNMFKEQQEGGEGSMLFTVYNRKQSPRYTENTCNGQCGWLGQRAWGGQRTAYTGPAGSGAARGADRKPLKTLSGFKVSAVQTYLAANSDRNWPKEKRLYNLYPSHFPSDTLLMFSIQNYCCLIAEYYCPY